MISAVGHAPWKAAPAPKPDEAERELQQTIDTMETMAELQSRLGRAGKARDLAREIAEKKKLLELMRQPPRQFPEETRAAIASYIERGGQPPAFLDVDIARQLEDFTSLHRAGVEFSDARMQTLPPVEAFVRLVERPWQSSSQQISIKTYEENYITTHTVRAEYLHPLAWFLARTQDGVVFYTPDRHERIETAWEFIEYYRNDPERASVLAIDGEYVPLAEAEARKARWIAAFIPPSEEAPPQVEDLGDSIALGGMVLNKRPS